MTVSSLKEKYLAEIDEVLASLTTVLVVQSFCGSYFRNSLLLKDKIENQGGNQLMQVYLDNDR